MDHEKLSGCAERIEGSAIKITQALHGLKKLHKKGITYVEDLSDDQKDAFMNLLKDLESSVNDVLVHNRFIFDETVQIKADTYNRL